MAYYLTVLVDWRERRGGGGGWGDRDRAGEK